MDLKTKIEVLPCSKCEDMIDCESCYLQKEAQELYEQIRAEVIDEFLKKDKECRESNLDCPYMNSEIGCVECIAEQLKEQNK